MFIMALANKDVAATDVAPKTTGKESGNAQLVATGTSIIAGLDETARENLASKSGTLHFVNLLGLQSKKAERVIAGRQSVETFKSVGVVLVSDEPITVPVIDITKDKDTGIDPATDITTKEVAAGEEFALSYYEFMYLIVRDEYSGLCAKGDNPQGVYLAVKMPAYTRGQAKLPTPTICFKEGSPKDGMIAIDEQDAEGKWVIKPEYAEKFGALLRRKAPSRSQGAKTKTPKPVVVAQALKKILGV
jgi:hypothetical protein